VYTFVVTGDAGGLCARNDTIVVTVDPEVFATASILPDTICSGEEVVLTTTSLGGSSANTYSWTSLPTGFTSTDSITTDHPLVPTDYIVTVTSGACLSKDTISVYARTLPSSDFQVNPDTLCEGTVSSVVYVGLPGTGYTYDWSFDNGNVLSGTGVGPYNVSWDTAGVKLVLLNVTDQFGCSSIDTVNVTVHPNPVVSFDANAAGCEPLAVTFNNTSIGGSTYAWDFGDGGTSTDFSPEHVYGAGIFDISLTVTSSEGCVSSLGLANYIEVLPVPVADAGVVQDITHPWDVSQATFDFVNNSQYATTYTWDFGDGTTSTETNPTHTYTYPDTFYVVLTASNAYCDDTIRIGPIIVVFYDDIFFPTAFSPNSDGINDDFHELQQVGISSLYFAVYNRWGELVYETNDVGGRWNGSYKGDKAEVGVYVWVAKAVMINGTPIDKKGNITLLR
jgi:gliding motility-associated-like protein